MEEQRGKGGLRRNKTQAGRDQMWYTDMNMDRIETRTGFKLKDSGEEQNRKERRKEGTEE